MIRAHRRVTPKPTSLITLGLTTLLGLGAPAQAQEFDFTPADPTDPTQIPQPTQTLAPPPATSGSLSGETVPTMPVLPQQQVSPGIQPIPATTTGVTPIPPTTPVEPIPQPLATPPAPVVTIPSDPQPLVPISPQTTTTTAYSYQRREGASPTTVGPLAKGQLTAGTTIPLTVYREISFPPFKSINSNLEVSDPILDQLGQVVIPAGSTVWGTFEPIYKMVEQRTENATDPQFEERIQGTRFVANRISIQNATYLIQGETGILPTGFDPNADVPQTALKGAGYGVAGGVLLGVVTGGLGLAPLLAGSLAGAAAGTTNVDRLVTLTPNTIIMVELTSDLIVQ